MKGSAVGIGKELEELKSRRMRLEAEIENQTVNVNTNTEKLNALVGEIEHLQSEKGSFQQDKDNLVNRHIANKQEFEKATEQHKQRP